MSLRPTLLLMLALLLAAPARADTALRQRMAEVLATQRLTGVVWSTVEADGTVSTGAAGLRNAAQRAPMAPSDKVQVGSIAKTLLALGALQMVTTGELDLDAPVELPGLAFDNRWAATDPVRLRHLLDHTAGLDDTRLSHVFSLRMAPDAPLAAIFAGRPELLAVRSRPGSRMSYSNLGYALLGLVIEQRSGRRYEGLLAERVLRPLGMTDSTSEFVTQTGPAADPRLAFGHFGADRPQPAVPTLLRPAGQFTTTAADMARLARFLLGDGRIVDGLRRGQVLISEPLLRAMGRPRDTEAAQAGLRIGSALGLATRDRHGAVGRCHGGDTIGYRAMLCMFERAAFFVAVNSDNEAASYDEFDRRLVEHLGVGAMSASVPAAADRQLAPAWEGLYAPAPNRIATFAWLDRQFGVMALHRAADGTPMLAALGERTMPLTALAASDGVLLRAPERRLASHALVRLPDGERVLTTGRHTWARTTPAALVPLWTSTALGLLGIAWLLLAGPWRLWRRRQGWRDALAPPVAATWALLIPVPLFLGQPFLALGDATPASVALAAVTAALPIALLAGLLRARRGRHGGLRWFDALALLAALQLCGVLAWWGLLPLRLWA